MVRICGRCEGIGVNDVGQEIEECKNCNGSGFTADTGEEWYEELERRKQVKS